MSRVLIFSQFFPSYHPRKGEETNFVFKIWNSLGNTRSDLMQYAENYYDYFKWDQSDHEFMAQIIPKHHTIRAGNRWKAGDKFSPRVWSGRPYFSKQITIAPDIEVKKVWPVVIAGNFIKKPEGNKYFQLLSWHKVSPNDGLSVQDFRDWFNKPFTGQIICWNENINY